MELKKLLVILASFPLLLSSCGIVPKDDGPHVPDIPTDIPDDPDDPITPDDPVDPPNPDEKTNHIEFIDRSDYYYVGETFDNVYRLKVKLFYNGNEKDISLMNSYMKFAIKDSSGNSIDSSTPFTKAGTYSLQIKLKQDETIVSDIKNIVVKESPTKQLTTKSKLPKGFTYCDFENSLLSNLSIPSKGDLNVLLIPVEITDYPFTSCRWGENYLTAIDHAFNGNGSSDTNYWESVSSYYKKTSKGQLNLKFDIAEVYKCGYSTSDFISGGEWSAYLMSEKAVNNFKSLHGNDATQKYDSDKDGHIDAVWMIYSAPNYLTGTYGLQNASVFWAFCGDYTETKPNTSSPTPHSFGWASVDFLYQGTEVPQIDTHIFIHETGHLLSLPDYYSYDLGGSNATGAQGGLAMMDMNIGDQDAFSKIALGWFDPYVATEDCIVTLKPNEATGECVLLADSWNGTAFDEYILLDLQTPTGLNEKDSSSRYYNRPIYYSIPGVRAYHVDARLGKFKYFYESDGVDWKGAHPVKDEEQKYYYLSDDAVKELVSKGKLPRMLDDKNVDIEERTPGYTVINANSGSRCLVDELFYKNCRLLTLVGADGKNPEIDNKMGSNDALFTKGDSWSTTGKTTKFFSSVEGVFNNEDDFSFVFSILECSSTEAKIQIRKITK